MNRRQRRLLWFACPIAVATGLLGAWALDGVSARPNTPRRAFVIHVVHHGSIREVNDAPAEAVQP